MSANRVSVIGSTDGPMVSAQKTANTVTEVERALIKFQLNKTCVRLFSLELSAG